MKKFYEEYSDLSILPPSVAKLPWTHLMILIDRIDDKNIRTWYAEKCIEDNWSKVVLEHQIDLRLYSRQAENTKKLTNFSKSLPSASSNSAIEMIKDPYIFDLEGLSDKFAEKELETAIVEKIKSALLELGKGFSFVGNQYRISTEGKDYYLDLLFYHIEFRCYVVVELKTVDFDPSFIGQLHFYVTAVD